MKNGLLKVAVLCLTIAAAQLLWGTSAKAQRGPGETAPLWNNCYDHLETVTWCVSEAISCGDFDGRYWGKKKIYHTECCRLGHTLTWKVTGITHTGEEQANGCCNTEKTEPSAPNPSTNGTNGDNCPAGTIQP